MRRVIAALVVVGLAIAVVVLWPRSDDAETAGEASTTTSTSSTAPDPTTTTSTTVATTSTTSVLDDHVVETVEEAEAILRELWFGWFEGIYNEDEERIRGVVGNPDQIEAAVEQFGEMEFLAPPTMEAIEIRDVATLRSDMGCLAVWGRVSAGFRTGSISGVHVFRSKNDRWLLINTWPLRGDVWESDCDVVLP